MEKTKQKKQSVRGAINSLEVGQSVSFPLSRYDYIVNCRSRIQMICEKRFTSKIDRSNDTVVITRTN
jgi:hypothetical protein